MSFIFNCVGFIEFKLGNGHIFSSQTGLIHKHISSHQNGIAWHLFVWNIQISWDKINIAYLLELAISKTGNFIYFLCSFLDFPIWTIEENVVDWGSEKAKENHQQSKYSNILKNINQRNDILKQKEWLSHRIEQILEIIRNLNAMLIFAIVLFSHWNLLPTQSLFNETITNILLDTVYNVQSHWQP